MKLKSDASAMVSLVMADQDESGEMASSFDGVWFMLLITITRTAYKICHWIIYQLIC